MRCCTPARPERTAFRRRIGAALVVAALSGCASVAPPGVATPHEVLRILVEDVQPPAADRAGWETVTLPDYWGPSERRRSLDGWYRASIALDAPPDDVWSVYLPRVGQTPSVWVNGVLVGGGMIEDPLPRDWVRPHFFVVPREVLHVGANDVVVRVRTHVGAPGYLRALLVGPEHLVRPLYDRVLWWQVGLTQVVAAASVAASLLLLVATIGRSELHAWRWFALGLFVWAWGSADAFVRHIPVSTHLWEWSIGIAPLWATVAFGLGFHRALDVARPRVDAGLVALGVVTSAVMFAAPPVYAFSGTLVAGGLAIAIAAYLAILLARVRGLREPVPRRFLIPATAGVLLGLHDVLGIASGHPVTGILLSPYIPAIALFTAGWVLLRRLVDSHRETVALNLDLERRVAEKGLELERNYARLNALGRDRAIAEERARLMRDVHDGVGGQLVSTLAIVETGTAGTDAVAESIRAALEDLRLVIDSLDPSEDDLLAVLASVRSRLEPRLARHGLRFAWQVTDLPAVQGFGPAMALQAMRIVQEAVTNVVKHATARTVTVRTGTTDGTRPGVFIEVADDGIGIPPNAPRGRGLTNMTKRATNLGGTIAIRSDAAGTNVRLWLPRDRASA